MIVPGTPLYEPQQSGSCTRPIPFEILGELAEMLEHTDIPGLFFSNAANHLLPRVGMPSERDRALKTIRRSIERYDPSALGPDAWRRL